jgi:single-stranded DNA-binding protein
MANINPDNFAIVKGRLASDPRFFPNKDGSRTVRFTILANQNFTKRNGERGTDAVSLERFIPADRSNGVFDMIHQGDLVRIMHHPTTESYTDLNTGETHYIEKHIVDDVQMEESRKVTTARLAKRAAEQDAQNRAAQAAQAAAPVQQAAPVSQAPVFADDALNASDPFGDGFDQGNPPF